MIKKIVKKQIVFNGEISTPSSLGDGFGILYQKSDGKLYWRSNDVSETDLTSGGGGSVDDSVVAHLTGSQFSGNVGVTGSVGVTGTLEVARYIQHTGDADTFIEFADDSIGITAGGEQLITIGESGQDFVKIGDGGDVDFQVRTLNDDNTLFVVGSSDRVGIGLSDPDSKLEVLSTSTQQKWSYDSNSFATMTVGDSSNTTIASGETGKITVMAGGDIELNADGGSIVLKDDTATRFTFNLDSTPELDVDGGFTLDCTGNIEINADGGQILFKDDTATLGVFASSNFGIGVSDPDQKLEVAGAIHISGETSTPSAPSNGDGGIMYVKTDGKLYFRSHEQSEVELTAGAANPGATLTMGTGAAEDTKFLFDGNAVDFRIGINDALDHFEIGAGTTMGSNTALRFTSTGDLVQIGSQTPSDGQVLYWDQTNSRVAWKTVAAGAALFFLLGGETAYNSNQFTYLGFTYATTSNDYPSPWPRYDAVGTITLA